MNDEKQTEVRPEASEPASSREAGRVYGPILRTIAASRYLFALAVLTTFVASVTLLLAGTMVGFEMVLHALGLAHSTIPVRALALETVDYFLVALVLYVLSMGFYQLLLEGELDLPEWLRIHTPGGMERQLLGVIVTVMSVDALMRITSWDGVSDLIGYGLAVAAIIAAITFYIWVHELHAE